MRTGLSAKRKIDRESDKRDSHTRTCRIARGVAVEVATDEVRRII